MAGEHLPKVGCCASDVFNLSCSMSATSEHLRPLVVLGYRQRCQPQNKPYRLRQRLKKGRGLQEVANQSASVAGRRPERAAVGACRHAHHHATYHSDVTTRSVHDSRYSTPAPRVVYFRVLWFCASVSFDKYVSYSLIGSCVCVFLALA